MSIIFITFLKILSFIRHFSFGDFQRVTKLLAKNGIKICLTNSNSTNFLRGRFTNDLGTIIRNPQEFYQWKFPKISLELISETLQCINSVKISFQSETRQYKRTRPKSVDKVMQLRDSQNIGERPRFRSILLIFKIPPDFISIQRDLKITKNVHRFSL